MRTAGIHLHQPPSPVTAANQQQREGAIMWQGEAMAMVGLHQGEMTHMMTADRTDMNFRWVRKVYTGRELKVKFWVGSYKVHVKQMLQRKARVTDIVQCFTFTKEVRM